MLLPVELHGVIATYVGDLMLTELWDSLKTRKRHKDLVDSLKCVSFCSHEEVGYFDYKFILAILRYLKKNSCLFKNAVPKKLL